MTEDEMVGWHHRLNGHEFGKTPGIGDGQGGLACCITWGCKESDITERLNWNWNYLESCGKKPIWRWVEIGGALDRVNN